MADRSAPGTAAGNRLRHRRRGRQAGRRWLSGPAAGPCMGYYADRARGMVASEIRALFAVAARPEIVSLAGGMPFIPALPLDAVGDLAGQLAASRGRPHCSTVCPGRRRVAGGHLRSDGPRGDRCPPR
jgi:hypothetical protein